MESIGYIDIALAIIGGLIGLSGAISLFMLRKIAFNLFSISLILGLLVTAWHILFRGWLQAIGGPGFVGYALGIAIAVLIISYTQKLIRRGILL